MTWLVNAVVSVWGAIILLGALLVFVLSCCAAAKAADEDIEKRMRG